MPKFIKNNIETICGIMFFVSQLILAGSVISFIVSLFFHNNSIAGEIKSGQITIDLTKTGVDFLELSGFHGILFLANAILFALVTHHLYSISKTIKDGNILSVNNVIHIGKLGQSLLGYVIITDFLQYFLVKSLTNSSEKVSSIIQATYDFNWTMFVISLFIILIGQELKEHVEKKEV